MLWCGRRATAYGRVYERLLAQELSTTLAENVLYRPANTKVPKKNIMLTFGLSLKKRG